MFRFLIALLPLAGLCSAQTLPAFRWAHELETSDSDSLAGIGADGQGNVYVVGSTKSATFPVQAASQNHLAGGTDIYISKLDPSGNIIYSTYFGGSGDDLATAMAVDAAGSVYVTGTTTSFNFPTTSGVFSPSLPAPPPPGPFFGIRGSSFLFKLNPDGSVAYSTYFSASQSTPNAIVVDSAGSAYIAGLTYGGLLTTPGAYNSTCACGLFPGFPIAMAVSDAFLARFDAAASRLIFSSYLGARGASGSAVAIAPDGSAYIPGPEAIYRLDATGSSLLASATLPGNLASIALASDGSVYMAGLIFNYGLAKLTPASGAFQPDPGVSQSLPYQCCGIPGQNAIIRMDAQLRNILSSTYFGGSYFSSISALALDQAGNVYVGGSTSPRSLPTRTPFFQGFGLFAPGLGIEATGYVAQLSANLTTLGFSSEFGDNEVFAVTSLATGANNNIILGGVTGDSSHTPRNVWVNSIVPAPPPALRIDAVENAASLLSDPISGGETILVRGAGFAADAQLTLGGVPVSIISVTPAAITAVVPADLSGEATTLQVLSAGAVSNSVLVGVAASSPGLFSADGSGRGQGFILNKDGTLNTPSNPAVPGDRITIYATGVGPVSFTNGYAVTQYPVNVFVDGFYCNGISAVMGPVPGFPGNVFQLSVYVPNPADLIASYPDLGNFRFPLQVGVILQIDGAPTQNGLAISIAQ